MSVDRQLVRIICASLDDASFVTALENKLIPNRDDYHAAVEKIVHLIPGHALGITRTKSSQALLDDINAGLQPPDIKLQNNGDILISCMKDTLCERDIQTVKALLKQLAKGSKLCHQLTQYHHLGHGEQKAEDNIEPQTEEARKGAILMALNAAGVLPIIQYIICDSLLTGGLGCASTGSNPAALAQEIAPLIVATGFAWEDFFMTVSPVVVLGKSPIVMAMELDNPDILLAVLGLKHFTLDTIDPYYDDYQKNLYGLVLEHQKFTIAKRIAEDLVLERKLAKAHDKTTALQGYQRLHLLAVKARAPLETGVVNELMTVIYLLKKVAEQYLQSFPAATSSHDHQPEAERLLEACQHCMQQINNQKGLAYEPFIIRFLTTYEDIYTKLSSGIMKRAFVETHIQSSLAQIGDQLMRNGYLNHVNDAHQKKAVEQLSRYHAQHATVHTVTHLL